MRLANGDTLNQWSYGTWCADAVDTLPCRFVANLFAYVLIARTA